MEHKRSVVTVFSSSQILLQQPRRLRACRSTVNYFRSTWEKSIFKLSLQSSLKICIRGGNKIYMSVTQVPSECQNCKPNTP
ncbi:hypothetical protein E2320_013505 [Naja naja]|nr:hypothetical protein E2320_013505 [Naja naja]